jgi:hypothetical protein
LPIQDLTTWNEVDPGSDLTVTSSKVTVFEMPDAQTTYLDLDMGADEIDEIDYDFEMLIETSADINSIAYVGVAAEEDTVDGWSTYIYVRSQRASGHTVTLSNGSDSDATTLALAATLYYYTLQRASGGDDAYLYIYDDSDRTNLIDTLHITGCGTDTYQYYYAVTTYNYPSTEKWDGYIQNINLNLNPSPTIFGAVFDFLAPTIGIYDIRYKLRSRRRDTALTTRVRNT